MDHKALCIRRQSLLPPQRGKIQDYYQLDSKEFAVGQFGKIFKAKLKGVPAAGDRAVKRILKKGVADKVKFMKEVEIMAQLDHPNILKMFETFEDNQYIYLVTELCEGGELFDKVSDDGFLSEAESLDIFRQLVSALNYLHSQEIVHRDIKPENIMFLTKSKNSPIKLIDFGSATAYSKTQPNSLKGKSGTAEYMAPEVITGMYDNRCDMWSAGVILYLMIAGCPPFDAETDAEVEALIRKMQYSFNHSHLYNMSQNLKNLISSLLTDSKNRLSWDLVMRHPWMAVPTLQTSPPPVLNISSLQAFASYDKLKRIAISLIVSQAPEKLFPNLSDSFKIANSSNSGTLSADELRTALQRQTHKLTADQINSIVSSMDASSSGKITLTQFVAANADLSLVHNADMIKLVFDLLNCDKDSKISSTDLACFFQKSQFKGDNALIERLVQEGDFNRDGVIDFSQFHTMMLTPPNL